MHQLLGTGIPVPRLFLPKVLGTGNPVTAPLCLLASAAFKLGAPIDPLLVVGDVTLTMVSLWKDDDDVLRVGLAGRGAGIPDCLLGAGIPDCRRSEGAGIPDCLRPVAEGGRIPVALGALIPVADEARISAADGVRNGSGSSWSREKFDRRDDGRERDDIVLWWFVRLRGVIFAVLSRVIVTSPSSSSRSDCRDLGRPKVRRRDDEGVRGAVRYRSELG
jgi:hypothetical protein